MAGTWLKHQLADLLSDFAIPATAALLPRRWMVRFLWHTARIKWLFPGLWQTIHRSERICFNKSRPLAHDWAWTTLMEAAQAWRMLFGLQPHLKVIGNWPDQPGFVAAGMHYGVGICALWHLRQCGLRPRFVFRPVERDALPGRPVKLIWYRLRTRLIRRLCPDGPIPTGGASEQILQAIAGNAATPVLLFDTPMPEPGDWYLRVGAGEIPLRSGGARLLSKVETKVAFFVVGINPDTGNGELSICKLNAGFELQNQIMLEMERVLQDRPGHWLLWHAVDGSFRPAAMRADGTLPDT